MSYCFVCATSSVVVELSPAVVPGPVIVVLVNVHDARNVPGRKTDVSDAAWLADLGAHGLVRASFVLPPPIRELRDLTRARTIITREQTRSLPKR